MYYADCLAYNIATFEPENSSVQRDSSTDNLIGIDFGSVQKVTAVSKL